MKQNWNLFFSLHAKLSWRNFDTLKLCNYHRLFIFAGISQRNFNTSLEIKLFSRYETNWNLFFSSHAKLSWRNFDTLKLCNYRRLFVFAGISRRNFGTSLEIKLFSRYETKLNLFFASHAKVSWRNLILWNYVITAASLFSQEFCDAILVPPWK